MKLVQDFNAFLNDTVNLNATRFDQLESGNRKIQEQSLSFERLVERRS